ncbi:cell division protein SepF [Actinoplanes sp. ATCC 53533]|uniref:cell division protein SepF n=1 Tax=Actinoplanes sp. ATCC 53533 TaxID=1288362 RepID=UPI000F77CB84|nr:cell division protein SepF [Actinoplanes sp. ATCC 53533]RSM72871.1 cell division protein SepF [Actinoplanes sp. ATCC 53533]
MSALRKAGVWLGLVEEDDQYDDRYREGGGYRERERGRDRDRDSGYRYADEFADEEDDVEEAPAPRPRQERSGRLEREAARLDRDRPVRQEQRASVSSITPRTPAPAAEPSGYATRDNHALAPQPVPVVHPRVVEEDQRYQITTLHPTTYREARTIGEHFRDGVPVIINLTEMDEGDARRLVDFAAGLAFGLRGTIERVTNRVFLLSPANVQVTAEDKAKIAEGGFFNQS